MHARNTPGDGNVRTNFDLPYYNTNAKNAEIYGAVVDPSVRLVSPVVNKGFISSQGVSLQRGFVVGIDNISAEEPTDPTQPARRVLLVIANQPGETPATPDTYVPTAQLAEWPADARASWRQLPFDPTSFPGEAPDIDQIVEIDPLETEFVTLFVVAPGNNAPVTVYAYDADNEYDFLGQLTVNGSAELGDLIDAPGVTTPINLAEIHDPALIEPFWEALEIIKLADSYDNPNARSPNARSTNYQSPNVRSPNVRSPNARSLSYESTGAEATSLESPNVRSPNVRSTAPVDSFIDVTYELESSNNTITAVNADFGYGGEEIDDENVQVIAWREDLLTTAQDCENGLISESKVISSKTSPNVRSLAPADIFEPFQGEVTFTLAPAGPDARAFVTMRVFCNDETLLENGLTQCQDLAVQPEDPDHPGVKLPSKLQSNIGYNFWAQKANTGFEELSNGREQIVKDVIDPEFSKEDGYQFVAVATDSDGALVDITNGTGTDDDKIGANDNGFDVDVECTVDNVAGSMPTTVKVPIGDSFVNCWAEDEAKDPEGNPAPNIGEWEGSIRVLDNTQPVLTTTPVGQSSVTVPPNSEDGLTATVDFIALLGIAATDTIARDGVFDISCELEDSTIVNSSYPFPLGSKPVSCTASDTGPCDPSLDHCIAGVNVSDPLNFNVIVADLDPPFIQGCGDPCVLANLVIEADADPMPVNLVDENAPLFEDTIDDELTIEVSPAGPFDLATREFELAWTATDDAGNSASATQTLIVQDTIAPVITGPGNIVRDTSSLLGLTIDFAVTAEDAVGAEIVCKVTGTETVIDPAGYLFPTGPTSVTCTASDGYNTAQDIFSVTVNFQYAPGGMSVAKGNPRSGTSIPVTWSWLSDGQNQAVPAGSQSVSINVGGCSVTGDLIAEDPGSSAVQLKADNSYQYNWQAVDAEGANLPVPETYCFTVTLDSVDPPQSQSVPITLKR